MVRYQGATMGDIPLIHQMINDYAQQGLMLRRPLMQLYESVRDFSVAKNGDTLVGTVGVHVLWSDLAEARSLAVAPEWKGRGIGRGLLEHVAEEATNLGITRLFALTYQQSFFEKCGFSVVQKEILPQKVWKECVYCDKFQCCDETAVMRYLGPAQPAAQESLPEMPVVDIPRWAVK